MVRTSVLANVTYGRRLRRGAKCLFLSEPDLKTVRGHVAEGTPSNIVTAERASISRRARL